MPFRPRARVERRDTLTAGGMELGEGGKGERSRAQGSGFRFRQGGTAAFLVLFF